MKLSFSAAINLALKHSMQEFDEMVVFGLDVDDHKRILGTTKDLKEEFGPDRLFCTPISEEAMTGVALGMAINGLRPVHVHIRADFLLIAMNQIVNMISKMNYISNGKLKSPLVIRVLIGRGWGQGPQHSKTLHSVLSHFPGLKVMMPTTPQDAYSLLKESIACDDPVIFFEHRWLYYAEDEVDTDKRIPIGKAQILREGEDITLICNSWLSVEGVRVSDYFRKRDISVEVIDLRTITPLDCDTIVKSVKKTGHCIVADYDWAFCGLSSEIASIIYENAFSFLKRPIKRIGFLESPCPTTRVLEEEFFPDAKDLIRECEFLLDLESKDLSSEKFYSYENKFKGPF